MNSRAIPIVKRHQPLRSDKVGSGKHLAPDRLQIDSDAQTDRSSSWAAMRRAAQARACSWAQSLQEQRSSRFVGSEKPGASFFFGQAQHGDLVLRRVTLARHDQLEHRERTILQRDLGDERLRRVRNHPTYAQGPVTFDSVDETLQIMQPPHSTNRDCLVANHSGDIEHPRSRSYCAAIAISTRPPANIARPINLTPIRARFDGSFP